MTSMMPDKCNVITAMAMKAAASLCMVVMVVGCSSGHDSSSRPVAPGVGVAGQVQAPNGALANKSEDLKVGCLTEEQKKAKMKELSEKDSWLERFGEHTVVRGGGNLLGSIFGFGNAGEYVELANDTKKMTVQGNAARDSIDTIVAKECGPEHKTPVATPGIADGTSAVK